MNLVGAAAKDGGLPWLEQAIEKVRDGEDIGVLFPAAGRKLGRGALGADAAVQPHGASLAAWRIDDAGRVVLIGALKASRPDDFHKTIVDLYQRGDARERVGVLRGIAFYGDDPELVPLILDALRTNELSTFEAALGENPYASTHLPQFDFRKAVLKAVFVGMSIRRIVDLDKRADIELSTSLIEYIEEREAATRSVLPELWPFIGLNPTDGAVAKILGYLEHPDAEHRSAAAEALATIVVSGDASPLPFLKSRAARETETLAKDALSSALMRCEA